MTARAIVLVEEGGPGEAVLAALARVPVAGLATGSSGEALALLDGAPAGWLLLVEGTAPLDAPACRSLVRAARSRHPDLAALALANRTSASALTTLIADAGVQHVLGVGEPFDSGRLTAAMARLVDGPGRDVSHWVSSGAHERTLPIKGTVGKAAILDAVAAEAAGAGLPSRVIEGARGVADELVTNAVHHAPRRDDGSRPYRALDRREVVQLVPREHALLRCLADDEWFAISVTDPFGSLDTAEMIRGLARCAAGGRAQMARAGGGAGMGLFYALEFCTRFIVNLVPGRRTEVIACFALEGSYRAFAQRPKSLHVLVAQNDETCAGERPSGDG